MIQIIIIIAHLSYFRRYLLELKIDMTSSIKWDKWQFGNAVAGLWRQDKMLFSAFFRSPQEQTNEQINSRFKLRQCNGRWKATFTLKTFAVSMLGPDLYNSAKVGRQMTCKIHKFYRSLCTPCAGKVTCLYAEMQCGPLTACILLALSSYTHGL